MYKKFLQTSALFGLKHKPKQIENSWKGQSLGVDVGVASVRTVGAGGDTTEWNTPPAKFWAGRRK